MDDVEVIALAVVVSAARLPAIPVFCHRKVTGEAVRRPQTRLNLRFHNICDPHHLLQVKHPYPLTGSNSCVPTTYLPAIPVLTFTSSRPIPLSGPHQHLPAKEKHPTKNKQKQQLPLLLPIHEVMLISLATQTTSIPNTCFHRLPTPPPRHSPGSGS